MCFFFFSFFCLFRAGNIPYSKRARASEELAVTVSSNLFNYSLHTARPVSVATGKRKGAGRLSYRRITLVVMAFRRDSPTPAVPIRADCVNVYSRQRTERVHISPVE